MKAFIEAALALCLVIFFLPRSSAQTTPALDAAVTFQFDRPALHTPGYIFEVHTDGRIAYSQTNAPTATRNSPAVEAILQISPALASKIFEQAAELSYFRTVCAAKMKGIADMGQKTLSYKGPDGEGSCTYNYSQNVVVRGMTDTFQEMALTLDEGRKLDAEHKYDRLALFAEMKTLGDLVRDGRAIEMGLIAGTLKSLIDDPDVLEKVRTKAEELLKSGK